MAFDKITPMIDKIIYDWVTKSFGETEALDPSWSIIDLAHEIAKHKRAIWRAVEEEFVREDILMVAEGMNNGEGVELSEKQLDCIVDDYMTSDAHVEVHADAIEWAIEKELNHKN